MLNLTSSDIASIVDGKLIGLPDLLVNEIVTDTRQLSVSEGLLFFALKGKNHDGHSFIENLYRKGIRSFVVEELPVEVDRYDGAAFILTVNSVEALQLLASFKRKSFN